MDWIHILLAAGRSSRMGTPKQLLETPSGVNFISSWMKKAREAGAVKSYLVLGFHAARVKKCLQPVPSFARVVVNPNPAADQTSSMKCALETAGVKKPALMTLVDQPPLPASAWAEIVPKNSEAANKIRIPVFNSRRGHPPWFPGWFLKEIYNMPDNRGINSLYSKYEEKIEPVNSSSPFVLSDFDTPAEYQNYFTSGR